ncbi:hypothetical protein [Kineosporia babensis]|uniref:Uncharacterized protein n=1 Tax=Kineosporia babensis TaxID=499548 RepID=A0A9X1NQB3_9ACTN|nr:hypothetical protein [Kineosporia babensis]MCD5317223.1 hypothetical protein [Kineosporia babensis]
MAAGLLGTLATLGTDQRTIHEPPTLSQVGQLSQTTAWIGVVAGYACVASLLVFAAQWQHNLQPRLNCVASNLVRLGFVSAAGALTLGYGWKGALAIYLPEGLDSGLFDENGLFIYYVLNDFGSYIGWLGVIVSAAGVAYLALRLRLLSRWLGLASLVAVLLVTGWVVGTGLPGFGGIVGPAWLVILGIALTFGRTPGRADLSPN